MAERSFAKEVKKLRAGAGEEFHGEGILGVTKALLQSGVSYVGGYQGAPISHLMDVFNDGHEILEELGVHFESSASEATAAATLAASVNYPVRGAVAWKSVVGTNVASDALSQLSSGGVTGGALVIIGEDYGEGSSIQQERTHAFAMKSQMWLLDPRPNLPKIVETVELGFQLSEASNTPVLLELRIRACHVHGKFVAKDNKRPDYTLKQALEDPVRDYSRIVLPPSSFIHEHEKVDKRWPAAVDFIREHRLNEFFDGNHDAIGLVLQGGLYNTVIRALERLGLADSYGNTLVPLYVLNVTYPMVDEEVKRFCAGKDSVLMIEEGQPEYIEQALQTILRRNDLQTVVEGKSMLPKAGEYTCEALVNGLYAYFEKHEPSLAKLAQGSGTLDRPEGSSALGEVVPARPPGFCTGCPERPIFTAMKLVERELGPSHVSCDIGCHLFSILPPFNIGNTTMGYGLGGAGAAAFGKSGAKNRSISVIGDGGFWHNGLTSSVGNAVFNENDNVFVIIDNNYAAATGGQDILSTKTDNPIRHTKQPIKKAVRGIGAKWVKLEPNTYRVSKMRDTLRKALTTKVPGPKVIIAQSECMLNRQRREKPIFRKKVKQGARMVRHRFGVDPDTCTGDHSCIRLSGCPSLTIKPNPDPLREDPVAHVLDSCVGCGLCGEVAHAAILCPSFYRAEIVYNPTRWDRVLKRMRKAVIGFFQGFEARRLARCAM
jgi:indolepyruvate ferredoxin oxidoreductase alpha subunit